MPALAIDIDKDKLRDFCRKWKITEFALFGSATRPEEFREDSDVDVLVSFSGDAEWSLFDHVHMQDELRKIFGRDVGSIDAPCGGAQPESVPAACDPHHGGAA